MGRAHEGGSLFPWRGVSGLVRVLAEIHDARRSVRSDSL
jgi:hypothetical protein